MSALSHAALPYSTAPPECASRAPAPAPFSAWSARASSTSLPEVGNEKCATCGGRTSSGSMVANTSSTSSFATSSLDVAGVGALHVHVRDDLTVLADDEYGDLSDAHTTHSASSARSAARKAGGVGGAAQPHLSPHVLSVASTDVSPISAATCTMPEHEFEGDISPGSWTHPHTLYRPKSDPSNTWHLGLCSCAVQERGQNEEEEEDVEEEELPQQQGLRVIVRREDGVEEALERLSSGTTPYPMHDDVDSVSTAMQDVMPESGFWDTDVQETLSRDDNSEASFGSSFGGATILHRPWTSAPPRCVTASGGYPRSVLYEDEGASWDSVLDDVLDDACVPRSAHVPAAHGMGAARVPFSSRRVECDADDEGSGSSSEFATDGGEGVHIPAANGRALRDRLQALGLSGSDVMGLSLLSSRR